MHIVSCSMMRIIVSEGASNCNKRPPLHITWCIWLRGVVRSGWARRYFGAPFRGATRTLHTPPPLRSFTVSGKQRPRPRQKLRQTVCGCSVMRAAASGSGGCCRRRLKFRSTFGFVVEDNRRASITVRYNINP